MHKTLSQKRKEGRTGRRKEGREGWREGRNYLFIPSQDSEMMGFQMFKFSGGKGPLVSFQDTR